MGKLNAALQSIHATKKTDDTPKADKIIILHYEKLHDSPFQYRDKGKSEEVKEKEVISLALDIVADGKILEPLNVRKIDTDEYEIIAGHKRKLAIKYIVEVLRLKKFAFVPCIVENLTEAQVRHRVISSNNQRVKSDWEIMYELEEKKKLIEECPDDFPHLKGVGRLNEKLAAEFNLSKSTVGEYLQISKNLSETAMEAFQSGELNKSAAVSMASLSHEEQDMLIDEGVTKQKDIKAYKEEKVEKTIHRTTVTDTVKTVKTHNFTEDSKENKAESDDKVIDVLPGQIRVANTDMELVEDAHVDDTEPVEAICIDVEENNIFQKINSEIRELVEFPTEESLRGETSEDDYYVRLSAVIEILEKYKQYIN